MSWRSVTILSTLEETLRAYRLTEVNLGYIMNNILDCVAMQEPHKHDLSKPNKNKKNNHNTFFTNLTQ